MTKPINKMNAEEFDAYVDNGGDVSELFTAKDAVVMQPNKTKTQKISGTIPCWIIDAMEAEADHLAVSRSAVMNMWLARAATESLEGKMAS